MKKIIPTHLNTRLNGTVLKATICAFLITVFSPAHSRGITTDTIKILTYNTLNYGLPATSLCPRLLSSKKHVYLREILKYADADIIGLEKMAASPSSFTTDTIPNKVLDSVCYQCYGHSDYTNHSHYFKEDMLYFKKDKFGYLGTTTLYSGDTAISDINLHRLYYKSDSLAFKHDTLFLNIILVHLLSGTKSYSASQRGVEMKAAMDYYVAHFPSNSNYIFMGDMNVLKSVEPCFQSVLSPSSTDTSYRFYDPVNAVGDWIDYPFKYASYLTHSTRINDPGDCGALGALRGRYDHILISYKLRDSTDSLFYLPNSYNVIGQDGKHVDKAVDTPSNTSAPANIINDLYYMSNHLPVELKLVVNRNPPPVVTAITNSVAIEQSIQVENPVGNIMHVFISKPSLFPKNTTSLEVYDVTGRKLFEDHFIAKDENSFRLPPIPPGVYILKINAGQGDIVVRKIIKE